MAAESKRLHNNKEQIKELINTSVVRWEEGVEEGVSWWSAILFEWYCSSLLLEYIRRLEFLQFEVAAGQLTAMRAGRLAQLRTQLGTSSSLIVEETIKWIDTYTQPKTFFQKLKYFVPKISLIILGLGAAVMAAWGTAIFFVAPVLLSLAPLVIVLWLVICAAAVFAAALAVTLPCVIANFLLEKEIVNGVSAAYEKRVSSNSSLSVPDPKTEISTQTPTSKSTSSPVATLPIEQERQTTTPLEQNPKEDPTNSPGP